MMDDNKKRMKRGVAFPVRLLIIVLLLLAEVGLVFAMVAYMRVNMAVVYTVFQLIGVALVVYIVNKPDNPSYKMSWVVFIILLPLAGCFFYMIRGGSRVLPRVKKRMAALDSTAAEHMPQQPEVAERLKAEYPQAWRQSQYLYRGSTFPVYDGTDAEFLAPGEKMLERLIEELQKAEKSIFIEFFILAEGIMWDSIHKILKEKAAAGVDVRIIFDDFGSIQRQSRGFIKRMRADGIKTAVFNPLRPSIDMFMNNRNHRKIVVIDGSTAFTGGVNIGDEYINLWKRHGYWLDSAVMIKGSAVYSFTLMFMNMWSFINGTDYSAPGRPAAVQGARGFVQPYCDGPFNKENPAEKLYMQILHTAQKYVYITTPYLILDDEMEIMLKLAAQSGVDVRIVTPKIRDKWYVHPVTRSYYTGLMKKGIHIYEYTPGFIHSKLFVSDDSVATVGSVNMDYRSFYFHFECGTWLCGDKAVADVKRHVDDIIAQSEEITLASMKSEPLHKKIGRSLLRLFAPFM